MAKYRRSRKSYSKKSYSKKSYGKSRAGYSRGGKQIMEVRLVHSMMPGVMTGAPYGSTPGVPGTVGVANNPAPKKGKTF